MATSTQAIYIDTKNQDENFIFDTSEGSTPTLRVYIYEDGTEFNIVAGQTAKFTYADNREASNMVEVDGTIVVGVNYIDFVFTGEKTAINGKFFASILLYDVGDSKIWVQSDGFMILKKNPALDGATILDTTTTINWDLYTNTGQLPWALGTDIVNVECSESPYDVLASNHSKCHLHNVDCDFTFILPLATSDTIGRVYFFKSKKKPYTITISARVGNTVDDSADGGFTVSVRNYVRAGTLIVQQLTATSYDVIWANGAFITN